MSRPRRAGSIWPQSSTAPPGAKSLGDRRSSTDRAGSRRAEAACRQRRPTRPVVFHSGRGCQYTSHQFASLAAEVGIRLSVGRTGQCWNNALAESFFSTIKRELLGISPWPSRAAVRTAIFDFIEGWYNWH
ncbi:integrase core domain-containing protein [Streptomyces griseus]|uniref:integrase core domain-containing protein n=1 Tax=Streptomyces griseus TaxID=1911 RepID=UPI0033FC3823